MNSSSRSQGSPSGAKATSGARLASALLLTVLATSCGQQDERQTESRQVLGRTTEAASVAPEWPAEVLVGLRGVRLDKNADITGDIAVLNIGDKPELDVDKDGQLQGSVRANRIKLDKDTVVTGNAAFNTLSGSGTVQGSTTTPLTLPLAVTIPLVGSVTPGASDLSVASGSTHTLPAGARNRVSLAKDATLRLSGGSYAFRSLSADKDTRIECVAACDVRILETIDLDKNVYLGPAEGASIGSESVDVRVVGGNDCSGVAVDIDKDAKLRARIAAPSGTLQIDKNVDARGILIGCRVVLKKDATVVKDATELCTDVDDGNPCTTDTCDPSTGVVTHTPVAAGTACHDADACNGDETCDGVGACQPGTPPVIDDGNDCTTDACDPTSGVSHTPVAAGTACPDADVCNGDETCSAAGMCEPGTPLVIDDGNPCTADACDPVAGVSHVPVPTGTTCADSNICNGDETCNAAGVCQAGTPPSVDDGNPCTTDACDPVAGVTHVPVAAGTACADLDLCNGNETCDGEGVCQNGTPPTLDDGNPCTTDACDPVAGVTHSPVPAGTACPDADVCNGAETCNAVGECQAGTPPPLDDGNACTTDACDAVAGVSHAPVPAGSACADADLCNGDETCDAAGVCQAGSPPLVDDGNPCTADACDPVAGVTHAPVPAGTACPDSDVCNGDELCDAGGVCQAGTPLNVDDGNPCTADACDPISGVSHTPVAAGTSCADADLCNGDETCNASGVCQAGTPLVVDDGNPCTTDACDPVTGVSHTPVAAGTGCGDGDLCNGAEVCDAVGVCQAGTPLTCDDGNVCTSDACNPASGCDFVPTASGSSCADADACNGDELCDGAGVCQAGTPLPVDDGNPCTVDACDPVLGVTHTPVAVGTACGDGDLCNGDETCDAGATCQAGTPPSVDDGNPCTADACDPVLGVTHVPLAAGSTCTDSDVCNGNETCDGLGTCQSGTPLACDDGNVCTSDACNPASGCDFVPVSSGTSCADGDLCNGDEICDGSGVCQVGTPLTCDDLNPCTMDACGTATGCSATPVPAGVSCGPNQACDGAGACVSVLPPDPSLVAPPLDRTVATSTFDQTTFLYEGPNPIQTGVAPGTISPQRVSVLKGRVLTVTGAPLPGATVSIVGRPEFGSTVSRADGQYDLVVNGGQPVALSFAATGYLEAQRTVTPEWQRFVIMPDVSLITIDANATTVTLGSASLQVASGSVSSDADGVRRARLCIPAGTTASLVMPDGSMIPAASLSVRLTEYTVGPNGPQAMPAELPTNLGYTYAVELTADEAEAAGAKEVVFSQPTYLYVDNFLGFPVGTAVPVGTYDRADACWKPSDNGRVIQVLAVTGGVAVLDVDGSGLPADAATLSALGLSAEELHKIGQTYATGESFWRSPIPHFSPYDCNFPVIPDTEGSGGTGGNGGTGGTGNTSGTGNSSGFGPKCTTNCPDDGDDDKDDPCERLNSSAIECQNQTFVETLPVAGTEFSLVSSGARAPGRLARFTMNVPLTGPTIKAKLRRVDVEVEVAGRVYRGSEAPAPGITVPFTWDGKDVYGRDVQGGQPAVARVGEVYPAKFVAPAAVGQAFAQYGDVDVSLDFARLEFTLWRTVKLGNLGVWDDRGRGLGGMSFDIHHAYDPIGKSLYLGSGRQRSSDTLVAVVVPLTRPGFSLNPGNGGPASQAFVTPRVVAQGSDGSIYVDDRRNALRVIGPDGVITHFAGGSPAPPFTGDGGPATAAWINVFALDVGRDGSVYLIDRSLSGVDSRVRRIAPDGIIDTIAGIAPRGFSGDEGPALTAAFNTPSALAVGNDCKLFIADLGNNRVRMIDSAGIVHTVAEVPSPGSLAAGPDGSIYIGTWGFFNQRVYRLDPSGRLTPFAGTGLNGFSGDGGPALDAQISTPVDLAVSSDGVVFISDTNNKRIRKVDREGVITTFVGIGSDNPFRPNSPGAASAVVPSGIEVAKDGGLLVAEAVHLALLNVRPPLPNFDGAANIAVASEDGGELYAFDSRGKHLATLDAKTAAIRYQFAYNPAGLLTEIRDGDNNVTTVQRDANGTPQAIIGPYGQATVLTLDANGYVSGITTPASEQHQFTFASNGLLQSYINPRSQLKVLTYDGLGRLAAFLDQATGNRTYDRTQATANFTVLETSALGRQTTYGFTALPNGDELYTNTFPDGTQSTRAVGKNRVLTTTLPDGTAITTTEAPDPRFGFAAKVLSQEARTPSGLVRTETSARNVTLADPLDALSLLTQTDTTTVNGRTTTSVFNRAALSTTTTSPAGRQVVTFQDDQGRTTRRDVPGILPVDFAYDLRGRLSTVTQGTRLRTTNYFDTSDTRNGYVQAITDALSQTTSFTPDAVGRVLQQLDPDGALTAFGWDGNGNLTSVTPPGQPAHGQSYSPVDLLASYDPPVVPGVPTPSTLFAYDLDRMLTQTTRPDGLIVGRTYDSAGKLDFMTTPSGIVDYTYFGLSPCPGCAPGRLAAIADPSGVTLSHAYDGQLLSSVTWSGPFSGSVGFTYDNSFRTTAETVTVGATVSPAFFGYDPDDITICASQTSCAPPSSDALSITLDTQNGRITGSSMGLVTDAWTYNAYGEMASYVGGTGGTTHFSEVLDTVAKPRDQLGRIVTRVEANGAAPITWEYSYDLRGRLTDVFKDGALDEHYEYDANGNRTMLQTLTSSVVGTYDAQDRLLTYGALSYTYTSNGELGSKTDASTSETTLYSYDVRGNLLRVDLANGDVIEYLIDGQDRRVGKKRNGALEKAWLYRDGLNPVAELDGTGALVSRFVYASRLNVPEYMMRGGVTYRILSDHLGSPRAIVDVASGAAVWRADYSAWGQRTVTLGAEDFVPFGFAGGIYDVDTGLVRFGARDYDPVVGRWTSKDPLVFRAGQRNLYLYVGGDPLNGRDPSGLVVRVCFGTALTEALRASGVSHQWIQTTTQSAGVLGTWWSTQVESHPPGVYDDVVCYDVANVDEECIDAFLKQQLGQAQGWWTPWNSCQTWVWDALNRCTLMTSSRGGGGEGAPGNSGGGGGISGW